MMTTELATFGAGCFWCVEAVFQQLKGVTQVVSGYMGGTTINPNYEDVCTGTTGHAEVIQMSYDPSVISYDELLEVLFKTHDPTTLNQQGADKGTQYRSVIFYHTPTQELTARHYKQQLDEAKIFTAPLVTEISPASTFYPAELYHQNYYNDNANKNPYCSLVITPKIEKFKAVFAKKLQ